MLVLRVQFSNDQSQWPCCLFAGGGEGWCVCLFCIVCLIGCCLVVVVVLLFLFVCLFVFCCCCCFLGESVLTGECHEWIKGTRSKRIVERVLGKKKCVESTIEVEIGRKRRNVVLFTFSEKIVCL